MWRRWGRKDEVKVKKAFIFLTPIIKNLKEKILKMKFNENFFVNNKKTIELF